MNKKFIFGVFIIAVGLGAVFFIQNVLCGKGDVTQLIHVEQPIKEVSMVNLSIGKVKNITQLNDQNRIVQQLNKVDTRSGTKKIESIKDWSYRIFITYEDKTTLDVSILGEKVFLNGTYYKVNEKFVSSIEEVYQSLDVTEEDWVG